MSRSPKNPAKSDAPEVAKPQVSFLDTRKSVPTRADEWIKTTGFAFEFEVATQFRAAGMNVAQSLHVPDKVEGETKALEIDVVASHEVGRARIEVVVECKTLLTPWVGFAAPPRPAHPFDGMAFLGDTDEVEKFSGAAIDSVVRATRWDGDPIVQLRPIRVPTGKTEDSFELLTGLSSKCRGRRDQIRGHFDWARIVPLLVVDGELATATWNPARSAFDVKESTTMQLAWRGAPGWERSFMSVTVVTRSSFKQFAEGLNEWSKTWCAVVAQCGPRVAARNRERLARALTGRDVRDDQL